MPSVIAFRILDAAVGAGADRKALCEGAGFNPAAYPFASGQVPIATQFALWEAAMTCLRDPGFPIAVTESHRLETYGVLALIAITSKDLQEALGHVMRFYRLWTSSARWDLEQGENQCHLVFVQPGDLRLGQRCDHEFALAEMTTAIRGATDRERWSPLEVRLQHARPPSVERHEALFGAPMVFGAARPELVLRARDLELPMVRRDRLLVRFFEHHAEELVQKLGDMPDEILRIRSVILEGMRGRIPRLSDVAAQLAIGARTLRRRLDAQGHSFKALVDQTRCALARQYLEQSRQSIGEIAYLLGFSAPSAFHRAFKRWTSEAPRQYRERAKRSRAC